MAWLQFVVLILGLLSGLYGTIQFWRWLASLGEDDTRVQLPRSGPGSRAEDRVLLRFNKLNVEKEGTWEHIFTTFHRKLPESYRRFGISAPDVFKTIALQSSVLAFILLLFCFGLSLMPLYVVLFEHDIAGYGRLAISCALLLAFWLGVAGSFLQYRKHWRAYKVALDYEDYFNRNGYNIDVELTQSKDGYDRGQPIRQPIQP